MKVDFRKILLIISSLWRFVYSYKVINLLSRIKTKLFLIWIYSSFKSIGKVYFLLPVNLRGMEFICISDGVSIGKRAMICAHKRNEGAKNPEIFIGKNVTVGDDCNIQCCNKILLGNGVLLGRKVMINDTSHGIFIREQLDIQPKLRPLCSKGPIVIEDNVWIGEMACVLGGGNYR